ncbi:MAG TPA: hypothetical protein VM911_03755 [Pyrinomonadaceae bacterium]|jgi:hypothetical protein|nr:hypothetical protein [Pyrinomonadaceae bacterium]
MFCPQCGSNQGDELKFCKLCGANLYAVRQVVATRQTTEKFDWSKSWVTEMFLSEGERKRRAEELEHRRGITPEVKRYREIKAGVITSSVGIALMIFLYVFMPGLILSGHIPPDVAAILNRVWIAGVMPLSIGLALLINGLFVSKRLVEIARQRRMSNQNTQESAAENHLLRAADTTEFAPTKFSVTEETTKHLRSTGQNQ